MTSKIIITAKRDYRRGPSCVEYLEKCSRIFILKEIFDFAIIPYLRVISLRSPPRPLFNSFGCLTLSGGLVLDFGGNRQPAIILTVRLRRDHTQVSEQPRTNRLFSGVQYVIIPYLIVILPVLVL